MVGGLCLCEIKGMAKKAKKHAPKRLTRKQLSRLEKERRIERVLIWSVAVVGIVVIGVLAYGFVAEKVIKAREPVAIVGGAPITTAEFQAWVRFTRMQVRSELQYWLYQQQALDPTDSDAQFYLEYIQQNVRDLQGQLSSENALVIGEQALDQLIQGELVRQEAERRGITVTPEELQREIELFFGYDRNPVTPTPAPTVTPPLAVADVLTPTPTSVPLPTPTPMTEQEFRRRYDTFLRESLKPLDISDQQYRSWIEVSLLMEKLREQMGTEVPTMAEQVKLRLLTVDSEERANELAARLDAGEDFQTLEDELEEDEDVTGYGTELGWLPGETLESRLGTELADLAFSLEVGEHSGPVLDQDSARYTIIEVMGHEVHELDQFLREQLVEEAFQEWLEAQQASVERRTYQDRVPTEP
jgi:parvulin-like peptidyl-prolyl isomerase